MTTFNDVFSILNASPLPPNGRKCLVKYNELILIGRMMDTRYFEIGEEYQGEDSPEQRNYSWSSPKCGVFLCIPKLEYSFGGNYFSLYELPDGMTVYFKNAENSGFRNVRELVVEYTPDSLEPLD